MSNAERIEKVREKLIGNHHGLCYSRKGRACDCYVRHNEAEIAPRIAFERADAMHIACPCQPHEDALAAAIEAIENA